MILTISTLFISFIFYAFLGWCFEMVHMGITTKEVVNRGFYNGPIVPIYGVGAILILILLESVKSNFILTVILITLICCLLEYFTSYTMEKTHGIRWWDYSNKKFNLNGRICLETMLMFVGMAILVLYYIHPMFLDVLAFIPDVSLYLIAIGLLILFLIDMVFSNYVLKKFKETDMSLRLDKTPAIRKYTREFLKIKN